MIQLINSDCLEEMRKMPDKSFDLAIVDPPYGIGETWSKSRTDKFYHKGKLHGYQNKDAPAAEYFKELFRVSRNQIIWGGNYFTDQLASTNAWVIWDKVQGKTFMSDAELAWTSFKCVMRIVRLPWAGGRKCESVNKIHPHQKPVKLYKWLLDKYAMPGNTILDTHTGSASIALACHDYGYDLTGFELDSGYHAASVQRYNDHISQQKLLLHKQPKHQLQSIQTNIKY